MKRLLALLLLFVLAFSLMPEKAAAATLSVEPVKEFRFKNPDAEALVFTITNTSKWDLDVTIEVYDQAARQNVQTMTFPLLKGDAPYPVNAYVYKKMSKDSEVNTYRYTIKSAGTTTYLYYAQRLRISGPSDKLIYTYTQFTNTNYPNNTVSSFGPHFREVTPELTDKWYMFTPIDLSLQGRQTFILAASNMYKVGEVYVDVNQDIVNVSYRMFYEEEQGFTTERVSDFLTFYNSYADVSIVEPEEMPLPSNFAFNQPFSIQGMLGGDTNVLMFIRNRISYYRFPAPKSEYIRFWENLDENKAQREGMLLMMDPIMNVGK